MYIEAYTHMDIYMNRKKTEHNIHMKHYEMGILNKTGHNIKIVHSFKFITYMIYIQIFTFNNY